jgi:hypothetical protein
MDLVAVLSNSETKSVYKRLTERQQVARVRGKRRDRSRDGRPKFGTVSGAVLAILVQVEGSMRFVEIHREVEELLGIPVRRSSLNQSLSTESRRRAPRFLRVGHGRNAPAHPVQG